MAAASKNPKASKSSPRTKAALAAEVRSVLADLERQSSRKAREDMATRYGIVVKKAWGVPMSAMQKIARGVGKDHE
ncbi:MAG: hypothetical protein ABW056_01840, partial [Thermoanaerobaculia bacterium]